MGTRSGSRCLAAGAVIALVMVAHRTARAQDSAAVTLPTASLQAIAQDFDAGRNAIYCFYGVLYAARVRVDSVFTVATPSLCHGIGIGYISRIDDRLFLGQALLGLIESNASFRVVTAFYSTVPVEVRGQPARAPRGLSVVRAAMPVLSGRM